VGSSDRIEAIVVALAVAISLVAAPVAGAIGTAVHDARSQAYTEAADTRHTLIATVTTTGHTAVITHRYDIITTVHARWRVKGIEHTDAFGVNSLVTAG
jgi:hypothetical protein